MKYLHWLVLNDGVAERVTGADVDPAAEAGVIDRVLIPLTQSGVSAPLRGGAYTVVGTVGSKSAYMQLLDEGSPIAEIAVCLHSRAARSTWDRLQHKNDRDMPANPPWAAVSYSCPETMLPPWFDNWTQTIGMALVRREGW